MNTIIKHLFFRTVKNFTSENIFQHGEYDPIYINSKLAIGLFDFGWFLFARINTQQKDVFFE